MALAPLREKAAAACSINVDLPIPGSPPTRIALPGTSPPPSTRSSSSIPEGVRGGGGSSAASPLSATTRPRWAPRPRPGPWLSGASSTIEFHSPQASQRPDHLRCAAPQAVQVKAVTGLAMARLVAGRAGAGNGRGRGGGRWRSPTQK